MSEIWVIKDNAPRGNDYTFTQVSIPFQSNGQSFSKLSNIKYMVNPKYMVFGFKLIYDDETVADAKGTNIPYTWTNNAYKTIVFETAPTDELLLKWLQANAEKIDTEYLTRKSELTSVADAIRAKGGTSEQLVYPEGFVSAIQAIETAKPEQKKTVTIATNNSTTNITPDDGKTLSKVTVVVGMPENATKLASGVAIEDGILAFTVDDSDLTDVTCIVIKHNSTNKTTCLICQTSTNYYGVHWSSNGPVVGTNYVSVVHDATDQTHSFSVNLGDSTSDFYDGSVDIYGL